MSDANPLGSDITFTEQHPDRRLAPDDLPDGALAAVIRAVEIIRRHAADVPATPWLPIQHKPGTAAHGVVISAWQIGLVRLVVARDAESGRSMLLAAPAPLN